MEKRVDLDALDQGEVLSQAASEWRNVLAMAVKADFLMCDTPEKVSAFDSVGVQFLEAIEALTGLHGRMGAFMVIGAKLDDTGEVTGTFSMGGSVAVARVMQRYVTTAVGAGLRASGACDCPNCLARTLVAIGNAVSQEAPHGQSH